MISAKVNLKSSGIVSGTGLEGSGGGVGSSEAVKSAGPRGLVQSKFFVLSKINLRLDPTNNRSFKV